MNREGPGFALRVSMILRAACDDLERSINCCVTLGNLFWQEVEIGLWFRPARKAEVNDERKKQQYRRKCSNGAESG